MIKHSPVPVRRDLFDPRSSAAPSALVRSAPPLNDRRSTRTR
jgi:hypothetical protein